MQTIRRAKDSKDHEELARLAENKDWQVRRAVGENRHSSPATLAVLSKDSVLNVRNAVDENPNKPEEPARPSHGAEVIADGMRRMEEIHRSLEAIARRMEDNSKRQEAEMDARIRDLERLVAYNRAERRRNGDIDYEEETIPRANESGAAQHIQAVRGRDMGETEHSRQVREAEDEGTSLSA